MKTLALHVNPVRGKEVIEILEMLGGINKAALYGNSLSIYFIGSNNHIDVSSKLQDRFIDFHLEDFLEKYPYKVGDMVQHKGSTSCRSIYRIEKIIWKNNQINYVVYNPWQEYDKCTFTAECLQPYKEELRQERKYSELRIDPADEDKLATEVIFCGNKIIPPNNYLIGKVTEVEGGMLVEFVKKQSQYPKTFQECYALKYNGQINLNIGCDILHGAYSEQLECLQNLLICRDVYWEIAGVEMGLEKPWKPDWSNNQQQKYTIHFYQNQLTLTQGPNVSYILAFPTKEMRDFFSENFKSLIEKCKEFL